MRFLKLFFDKEVKKQLIKEYDKGVKHTNSIRDVKDRAQERAYFYEINKRDEEIAKLKKRINDNDIEIKKKGFLMTELNKALLELASHEDVKQVEENRKSQVRKVIVDRALMVTEKIIKDQPKLEKHSSDSVNNTKQML